jgi:hypothetical protein
MTNHTRKDKLEHFEKVFNEKKYESIIVNMVSFVQDYEYYTRMGKLERFEKVFNEKIYKSSVVNMVPFV